MPLSYKKALDAIGIKKALNRAGVLPSITGWGSASFIIVYHGIGEGDVPADSLEQLLRQLAQSYEFRKLDNLLEPRSPGDRPVIYLTFDDGLRNNYTLAYPVLQRLSIPATFYVCPALIDSTAWLWTHEMRERLNGLSDAQTKRLSAGLCGARLGADSLVTHMKGLPVAVRREHEQAIRSETPGFRPTAAQRERFDVMSWDELRQLDPQLITVGSHSMTHAMLDSLTPEEAEFEIVESRRKLENALDREVAHFCYPCGQVGPLADALVRGTYRTAATIESRCLPQTSPDPYRLPRVAGTDCPHSKAWTLARATIVGRLYSGTT
jgi:peptidoglycan/xylan/chitin deacetylase (PgdA/CDA1 family)